jgi:hypothetical protein
VTTREQEVAALASAFADAQRQLDAALNAFGVTDRMVIYAGWVFIRDESGAVIRVKTTEEWV